MIKFFIHIPLILFTIISCSATNKNYPTKNVADEKIVAEENKSENSKLDVKKLAKEAGYMVGWDIVLAGICKAGLHLSVGVCLVADVLGDVGIILYSNIEPAEAVQVIKNPENNSAIIDQSKSEKITEKKKKSSINPLEFVMGVGLMATILLLM